VFYEIEFLSRVFRFCSSFFVRFNYSVNLISSFFLEYVRSQCVQFSVHEKFSACLHLIFFLIYLNINENIFLIAQDQSFHSQLSIRVFSSKISDSTSSRNIESNDHDER
jgi:hypothetical protein